MAAHPRLTLALALAALVVWRFLAARDAGINLSIDEAQYFLWSLEPAWGYYSKPPLIAWTIAVSTALCGDSEACIRLPALLLFTASAVLVGAITARLYDMRHGVWAALAFATCPLTSFYAWVMTTDSLLLFFWSLSLWLFLRALERNAWGDWFALGLSVGFGLLAKYTMSLFFVCALLVLWSEQRPRLAEAKPWVAALLAAACLMPNLVWNLTHEFATLRHTAEISQLDRDLVNPASLAAFVAAQFGVMGPLLFAALLAASADRAAWRSDARLRLLGLFVWPVLALFVVLSFLSRAHANWAAPAYVAASAFAVLWLLGNAKRRWLLAAVVLNLALSATLYHWHHLAPALGIELKKGTDPFHPVRGWEGAGRALAQSLRATGCRALIAADRGTLVELAYYARRALNEAVVPLAYNPEGRIRNHFELTADLAQRPFECALLAANVDPATLRQEFGQVVALGELSAPNGSLALWQVSDFRGYATRGR